MGDIADETLEERVYRLEHAVAVLSGEVEGMRRVVERIVPIFADNIRELGDIQHELKRLSGEALAAGATAAPSPEEGPAPAGEGDARHPHHLRIRGA